VERRAAAFPAPPLIRKNFARCAASRNSTLSWSWVVTGLMS
jgi:hypothetical protein